MSQKQKARPEPGKDTSSEIVIHCAACGATIRPGDLVGGVALVVGVDFSGRLLGEHFDICHACFKQAHSGEAGAAAIEKAVSARRGRGHGEPAALRMFH